MERLDKKKKKNTRKVGGFEVLGFISLLNYLHLRFLELFSHISPDETS